MVLIIATAGHHNNKPLAKREKMGEEEQKSKSWVKGRNQGKRKQHCKQELRAS